MTKKQSIQLFNDRKIRTAWDDKEEKWIEQRMQGKQTRKANTRSDGG